MDATARTLILEAHRLRHASLAPRAQASVASPATEAQLATLETLVGPIPPDVRWYLGACGGGAVGHERLDDLRELVVSHRKLAVGRWQMRQRDAFLVGWDATGGPIAVERTTGRVLVEDGFFGGVNVLAPSFERFLLDGLVNGHRRWGAPAGHAAKRAV